MAKELSTISLNMCKTAFTENLGLSVPVKRRRLEAYLQYADDALGMLRSAVMACGELREEASRISGLKLRERTFT